MTPPLKSPRSNRKVEIVAGIVALAVVIVGVVLVTGSSGSGNPSAQPTPDISSLLQQLDAQPTGPSTSGPTALPEAATCVTSLTACLMPAPSGSTPLNDAWGRSPATESASQYVGYFYGSDDTFTKGRLKARLSAIGETAIAKRTFQLPDGVEVDDELLSFSTENGAQSWYDSDTDGESGTQFAIPGVQQGVQGYNRTPDSSGIGWSIVYGYSDSTAMELWVEKKGKNDSADAATFAATQMQAVEAQTSERIEPVAPSPSAAPFTPAGGGSAACAAGNVDSCLVARPAGSEVWTGKPYYAQTDVTVAQYVDDNWNPSDQSNMIQILGEAGVQKIAHRDWTTTTDLQADVTVLQYDSAADAQTQDESFQGTLVGATFSIDGISAQGAVRTMNSNGDVDVEISGDSGPYQVVVNSFSPATANVSAAVQLFEQEFDLLPAS